MSGISNGSVNRTETVPQVQKTPFKTNEQLNKNTVHKKKLVRKNETNNKLKQKLWLGGHITVMIFGLLSLICGILRFNRYYIHSIFYRFTFLGAMLSLGATASHKFGIHNLPPISALLAHQNFQYAILSGVWLLTFKSIFKIIPYFLISLLQLAQFKNIQVITNQANFLASIIAYDELFLIVYLFLRTLLFRNTSGFQFLAFLTFYWLRILFNVETDNLFAALIDVVDDKVKPIKNEKVQVAWKKTRTFIAAKQKQHI